jgi:hypothetical protein
MELLCWIVKSQWLHELGSVSKSSISFDGFGYLDHKSKLSWLLSHHFNSKTTYTYVLSATEVPLRKMNTINGDIYIIPIIVHVCEG